MGIDESRQHNFARTIDLGDLLRFFFSQGSRRASLVADRNDLPAKAQHGAVFDDAKLL